MTIKPDNVRIANPSDKEAILALMRMAWSEQPLAPLAEDKLCQIIKIATDEDLSKRKGIIGVIDGDDGLEGYFCAVFSEWWFSNDWRMEELTTFVHPAHRTGKHFKSLIQFAKWAAESFGVVLVMGITASERLLPKIRLYEREISPFGGLFYHNAKIGPLAEVNRC